MTPRDGADVRSASPAAALWFLYTHTARNRLRSQIKRIRSPRYIAAVIAGILYLWGVLFRNGSAGGGPLASVVDSGMILPVLAAFLMVSAARWWIFGADRGTLAFAPAEVQFLFPAPVSRRALVNAKLVRTQLAILLNTVIFTVLLRDGGSSAQGWRRGLALWVGFSVLALHRLGAAIVRANALEHARPGQRRSLVPILVFGALLSAVMWGLLSRMSVLRATSAQGFKAVGLAIVDALQQPIPSAALWPVRAVLAPIFATTAPVWWSTLPFALGILLVHYLWIVRLDASFEEAALEATQHRAERLLRFRSSQMGKTRSRKGKLARVPRLPSFGPRSMAVAWKNVAAAIRGGGWRSQLITFTIGLVVMAIVIRSASEDAAELFVGITVGWGVMLVFVGPLWMRFDLRLDLPRLSILKTWPLPGRQIVAAEIAAVTLLHSVTIWSLMLVPMVMTAMDPALLEKVGAGVPVFLAIAIGIPILNALMFTVQNGTALLFPAWVKLGTEARGFETMGQNLLTMGATTLVSAVALVFPVGLGLLIVVMGRGLEGWALPLATFLGGILLLLELWPVVIWLGDVFDRTDVNDVAVGS
ncbi:MAG: putative ABC exporter domain-containing protein [Gemmatimonas sp.]